MSGYEGAMDAVADMGAHRGAAMDVIDAFLDALPPSIVVDGKVVELAAINHGFDAERCPWFYDGCNCPGAIAQLIDAAREVAEGRET